MPEEKERTSAWDFAGLSLLGVYPFFFGRERMKQLDNPISESMSQ